MPAKMAPMPPIMAVMGSNSDDAAPVKTGTAEVIAAPPVIFVVTPAMAVGTTVAPGTTGAPGTTEPGKTTGAPGTTGPGETIGAPVTTGPGKTTGATVTTGATGTTVSFPPTWWPGTTVSFPATWRPGTIGRTWPVGTTGTIGQVIVTEVGTAQPVQTVTVSVKPDGTVLWSIGVVPVQTAVTVYVELVSPVGQTARKALSKTVV